MPIAQRSILEESQQQRVVDDLLKLKPPSPPQVELNIFEQISEFINRAQSCKEGASKDKKKIEELSHQIEAAEQTISRAQEKVDSLQRKNNFLRAKLDQLNERKSQSIKYWQDYGLDVKQSTTNSGDDIAYEFIYTKLNHQELLQPITVVVKPQGDEKLRIVSRTPTEALSDEALEELNNRLEGHQKIDYKLAMLMIKKELIKRPGGGL